MKDDDWDLIDRYLGNECAPDERERVERLLAGDAQARELVEGLRLAGARMIASGALVRVGAVHQLYPGRMIRRGRRGARLAAGILLAGGLALGWRVFVSRHRPDEGALATRELSTQRGQRATLRLADGTRVVLGPASSLRNVAASRAGSREVELKGDAYFDVVHDAGRPFRVHAGNTVTEDVGTAFMVHTSTDGARTDVVVASGRVSLAYRGRNSAALAIGDLASASDTAILVTHNANVAALTAWADGRLVFDRTKLPDVLAQLERWYDVDFRLDDASLAARDFTGSFQGEPVSKVLDVMAPAVRFRYTRHGRTVVLSPVVEHR
jgi:transmembrane sensor